MVIEKRFKRANLRLYRDRVSPDISDFPDINLAVGDDVGTSGGEMSGYSVTDAVFRLPDINRHVVEITERVDANGVSQLLDGNSSIFKVSCQATSSSGRVDCDRDVSNQRLDDVLSKMPDHGNGHAISG